LQSLQARLEMQTQVLQMFNASLSDAAPQLIDYMQALAARPYPGVWITGFHITPAVQSLSLSGNALQTQDIPAYLGQLSAQHIFAGTQFSGLQFKQLELVKPTPAAGTSMATASAAANTNTTASSPLPTASATDDKASPAASAGGGVTQADIPPAAAERSTAAATLAPRMTVYAFEVKGLDMQAAAKQASGMSWDAFVEQTIQAAPAK